MAEKGNVVTFANGEWHNGDPKLISIGAHSIWLGSAVFDGARSFDGCMPDLRRHCERLITSAEAMGLGTPVDAETVIELAKEGVRRLNTKEAIYLRPLIYAEDGFMLPEVDACQFAVMAYERPLPPATGFSACRVSIRRPGVDQAPTAAKAGCLYPNVARSLREAASKGCDTGLGFDPNGNVAEFSMNNLFFAKDGVVTTPVPNGTFLNGITRQRITQLLRHADIEVQERTVTYDDVANADEIFATGNYAKIIPCTRLEDRELQPGPLYKRARDLYFEFAHDTANAA